MRFAILLVMALGTAAHPASSQSMNTPAIVGDIVGGVCAPLMQSGDVATAIATAEALGYAQTDESRVDLDPDSPNARAILYRRHRGTVTISLNYGRVLCSVGINEAGVSNLAQEAGQMLAGLGMVPILDIRGADEPAVVVWRGQGRQAVISPSPVYQPGAEITLSAHFH